MAAVRKMLVKRADVEFPVFVHEVINTDLGQNIEGKILTLTLPKLIGAVDKSRADSARSVGLDAPAGLDEDVSKAHRNAEVTVLRPPEKRLRHGEEIDLIIAAEEAVIVAIDSPAQSAGEKLGADFVGVRISDKAENVRGFSRKLEVRRLEWLQRSAHRSGCRRFACARAWTGSENPDDAEEKEAEKARDLHERAERYFEFLQLQSSRTIVMLRS